MFGNLFTVLINFNSLELILSNFDGVRFLLFKINFVYRIDSVRIEKILFYVRITFRRIIKYKLLYLKINFNKINSIYNQFYKNKIKYALNTYYFDDTMKYIQFSFI